MQRISSRYTFFYKKIFPIFWFGFLAFFIFQTVSNGAFQKSPISLVVPCLMAIFGFVIFKKLLWELADEVYDDGDYLLVRNNGQEEMLRLSDIMNVSATTNMNPPRITLRLIESGKFGAEVSFFPTTAFTLNPFAKNPVAEDLIVRVDKARVSRRLN